MRKNMVVVVLNGPRRLREGRDGEMRMDFCPRRVVWAAWLAKWLDCRLIVCGDANGGEDLRRMELLGRLRGAPEVIARRNGVQNNTEGDCLAASTVVDELPEVSSVLLVTCSYHLVRAWLKLRRHCDDSARVFGFPIPTNPFFAATHWMAELRGIASEVLGRQVGTPRYVEGEKPAID